MHLSIIVWTVEKVNGYHRPTLFDVFLMPARKRAWASSNDKARFMCILWRSDDKDLKKKIKDFMFNKNEHL